MKILPSLLSCHNFVEGYCSNGNGSKSNILVLIPQPQLLAVLCFILKDLEQRFMLIPPCERSRCFTSDMSIWGLLTALKA